MGTHTPGYGDELLSHGRLASRLSEAYFSAIGGNFGKEKFPILTDPFEAGDLSFPEGFVVGKPYFEVSPPQPNNPDFTTGDALVYLRIPLSKRRFPYGERTQIVRVLELNEQTKGLLSQIYAKPFEVGMDSDRVCVARPYLGEGDSNEKVVLAKVGFGLESSPRSRNAPGNLDFRDHLDMARPYLEVFSYAPDGILSRRNPVERRELILRASNHAVRNFEIVLGAAHQALTGEGIEKEYPLTCPESLDDFVALYNPPVK
ncbi:MAG: hypothetical protein V1820_00485 [archaeon]